MSEDERYYLVCPLRKNRARVPVTVCEKNQCIFLASKDGKLVCDYPKGNPRPRKRK
jgi:hypothetical protein